jgi:hypothetical protein
VVGGYVRKRVVLRISIGLKICCTGSGGTAGEFEGISRVIIHHLPSLNEKIGPPLIKLSTKQ